MNNNIFDIQRFGKLLGRQWLDPKNLTLRNFIFAAMPILFLLINSLKGSPIIDSDNSGSFLIFAVIFVLLFSPFMFFNSYNHPKKGITNAMLPASSLEKFIVMQLTGLIYAPLFIFITYGAVDALLSFIFPKIMGNGYAVAVIIEEASNLNWEKIVIIFTVYQSMIFCNLWFIKNKLLKTFGIYIALWIGMLLIVLAILWVFTHYIDIEIDNINYSINSDGSSMMIKSGDHPAVIIIKIFRMFINIVMPIGLTIGSYFMLKTKRY